VLLSHGGSVYFLAVLADGRLASGGDDGNIKVWPKEGAAEPMILSHGVSPSNGLAGLTLAVLGDGRLVSAGSDGKIKIWPKEDKGEPVLLSHGAPVRTLAVLADGRLASGGEDGRIRIWLVDEQKPLAPLCLRAGRNLTKAEWARYVGPGTPRQPSCRDRPSNWRTVDR
jgi:WD40 repeat protein